MGVLKINGINILELVEVQPTSKGLNKRYLSSLNNFNLTGLAANSHIYSADTTGSFKVSGINLSSLGNKLKRNGNSVLAAEKGTRPILCYPFSSYATFADYTGTKTVTINKNANNYITSSYGATYPFGQTPVKVFYLQIQAAGGSGAGGGSGGGGSGGGAGACTVFRIESQYLPMTIVMGYRGQGHRGYNPGLAGYATTVKYRNITYTLGAGKGGVGANNVGGEGGFISSFNDDVMLCNWCETLSGCSGSNGGNSKKPGNGKYILMPEDCPSDPFCEYYEALCYVSDPLRIYELYKGGTSSTSAGATPGGGGAGSHCSNGGNGGPEWVEGADAIRGAGGGGGGWTNFLNNRSGGDGGGATIFFYY